MHRALIIFKAFYYHLAARFLSIVSHAVFQETPPDR
jgi:hypothetical protein